MVARGTPASDFGIRLMNSGMWTFMLCGVFMHLMRLTFNADRPYLTWIVTIYCLCVKRFLVVNQTFPAHFPVR